MSYLDSSVVIVRLVGKCGIIQQTKPMTYAQGLTYLRQRGFHSLLTMCYADEHGKPARFASHVCE